MKRTLTILAAALLVFSSCDNDAGGKITGKDTTTKAKGDTSFPVCFFLSKDSFQINNDVLGRLIITTNVYVGDTNSTVMTKIDSFKDSLYFAQGQMALRGEDGKPLLDSAGNQRMLEGFVVPIPKSSVWDTGVQRDSVNKKFKAFLKERPKPQPINATIPPQK